MRPLSILMIDIDHFNAVNDRFGHAAGDRVLQNVAAICRAEKRDPDVVARVGGEEFAVMLPETTEAAAAQFAERLRRQVHDSTTTVHEEKVRVTISIGVAGVSLTGASGVGALMRQGDEALYEAKRLGRNRVVVCRSQDRHARMPEAAE
jgi:diguanylate cyclase (GGDEF)-like protein